MGDNEHARHDAVLAWPRTAATLVVAALVAVGCGGDSDNGGDDLDDTTPASMVGGLGIDYALVESNAIARYDVDAADSGTDLFAAPWPSNRLLVDGKVTLSGFPNPGVELINTYLEYGEQALDGFGRNSAIYFGLEAPIDLSSLPSAEAAKDDPLATVQLVAVDGPTSGAQSPIVFSTVTGDDDPYYAGHTLALRPVWGFPLADATTYCAVLTRGVTDEAGRPISPNAAFTEALSSGPSLAPLREWLPSSPLQDIDIAAATCFTTQHATREMGQIQSFLETRPTTGLTDIVYNGATTHFHELTAMYVTPNFQAGDKPYREVGGDLQFDEAGEPIVQLDEPIRVRLLIPRNSDMPADGWPVVLYSHGTFGDWSSCLDATDSAVMKEGLAMICIDQPLHGIRGDETDPSELVLTSFNFLNPRSGRMSFRQAAADTVWLTRMVSDGRFDLDAADSGFSDDIKLDADTMVFFGHSHGALAGAIVLGVDPRIKGAVLSGGSGVMVETLLRRKDPADLRELLAFVAKVDRDQLDAVHPVMTLAQTLVDATDPINYAPYWLEPTTGGNSKHLLMTSGTLDHASPAVGADAVAAAGGLPVIEPVVTSSEGHVLRSLAPVSMPVNNNLISSTGQLITAGLRQYDGGDHWVALEDPDAILLWRGFLRAFRAGDVPVIAP